MKFLVWIALLIFVYWYFFKRKKRLLLNKPKELITELVLDENCQTYIRKEEAIKVEINGRNYYFCSKKCLSEFLQKNLKLQP